MSAPPDSDSRPTPPDAEFLWLRGGDQWLVATLTATTILLLTWHAATLSGWGRRPIEVRDVQPRPYEYRLDINRATWVEWLQLEGIGEKLARRIVADREEHGPFRSHDDLARVPGIGAKTVDRLRPWLLPVADDAIMD